VRHLDGRSWEAAALDFAPVEERIGWLVSAGWRLALVGGSPPAGRWSEELGRQRAAVAGGRTSGRTRGSIVTGVVGRQKILDGLLNRLAHDAS
jgi:hypothetical protein